MQHSFILCLLFIVGMEMPAMSQGPSLTSNEPWQANEDLVRKSSKRQPHFNFEESKVPAFELPAILPATFEDDAANAKTWIEQTKPELLEQFRTQVYGHRPKVQHQIRTTTEQVMTDIYGGKAIGYQNTMTIVVGEREFSFPFVLIVPKVQQGTVPAVVFINNRKQVSLNDASTSSDPFWPARELIEKGYATASFFTSDVDPDDKDRYQDGVRRFFADEEPPTENSWGSLSAWGWAASQIREQISDQPSIDASRIAVAGHSRGGKTALWAAAEDQAFAVAYSNESGCGGAALSRRQFGETIERITSVFPHWFCRKLTQYSNRESELPVDQHQLIAMIAPRGVYVSSADGDLWADPRGEYLSLAGAAPAFELHGLKAISDHNMPAINVPRVVGRTGYHIRSGKHDLTAQDWTWFLQFADVILSE